MAMADDKTNTTQCFSEKSMKSIWEEGNAYDFSFPQLVLQLAVVITVTHIVIFILKPTRQPRIVAEILAGVILGPSILGRNDMFMTIVFPIRSQKVLETMSDMGILYYLFIIGVEMDLTVICRTGKKAWTIAIAGIIIPFIISYPFHFLLTSAIDEKVPERSYNLFMGTALSATAFPVVARILAEHKLISTELGTIAMSSALINDLATWILLLLVVVFSEKRTLHIYPIWVIVLFVVFVLLCICVVRPAISWIIRRTPEGEAFSEFHICLVLTGVLLSGFITDVIGTHPIFGAFVFGLVIPNGALGVTLVEKLEDFVTGFLMPLFFTLTGMKIHLHKDDSQEHFVIILLPLACGAKAIGTLFASRFFNISKHMCFNLGLLLNAKGIVELIVLNIGLDQKVLDRGTYAFMVYTTVIMTGIITPVLKKAYKPTRRIIAYKRRTIQRANPDGELRVLVCIHSPRNVPTIINLLEASHPTKKSPLCLYALHLVELTGRVSAMLGVYNTQAKSNKIINAFQNYEEQAECVTVQPLTAISPYSTMHEDICNLAMDKRVAFIIVPFHKQQAVDGGMEDTNPAFRIMNQNVLANAPCSVGILIDRGLTGSTRLAANQVSHQIAVLFFGGPDDREALSYGWKMSEHPGTRLTVKRFLLGENVPQLEVNNSHELPDDLILIEKMDRAEETQVDEDFIKDFRMKTAHDDSIIYTEEVVNDGSELVNDIRSMENIHDLCIVGRGERRRSPLTEGLNVWSECPELGAVGDFLASSDFAATVSVLVVQQYFGFSKPDRPSLRNEHFNIQQMKGKPPLPTGQIVLCRGWV